MQIRMLFDARQAERHLRRADPRLAVFIACIGPLRMKMRPATTPFEALVRSITYQQLSGKAAATIHGRLLNLFSEGLTPERLLALPEAALLGAGLSRNKLLAVRDLAAKTLDGIVPDFCVMDTLTDEEVIERLTVVRGIGRWSVEMLLIHTLGRPDVLPVDDLGIRKGFQLVYGMKRLPAAATLRHAARKWAPYRSAASWYLWRTLDAPL